ncbi:hypothetical protein AQZ52_13515 [Novosphingobium fuchskuhlense]|uniref:Calcium-binding protein n=1 Tax=Novosphingobium fuchskuhlense TaxID=1117702 RepID=A0A117UU11_9SPHN|nr:hypothetical protein [Novosphingobium fuchskuhlense]KUR70840.1 hypothetical protein AQZ52_13515 [Novosphingobium fuchskuhlense]
MPDTLSDLKDNWGTGPGGEDIVLLDPADFHLGLSSFSDAQIDQIISAIPFTSHTPGTNYIDIDAGAAGFGAKAKFFADFSFGLALNYTFNLGQTQASASGTKAFDATFDANGDGRVDLYGAYDLNTAKAQFTFGVHNVLPQNGETVLGLGVKTSGNFDIGFKDIDIYTPLGSVYKNSSDFFFSKSLDSYTSLFKLDQGDPPSVYDTKGIYGSLTAPRLPDLAVSASGGVGATATSSGVGPDIGLLKIMPLEFVPVIGQVLRGGVQLLASDPLDVILEWELLHLSLNMHLGLAQDLKVTLAGVDSAVKVEERSAGDGYTTIFDQSVAYGSTVSLPFSQGDRLGTRITETYTLHLHSDSTVALDARATIELGLLYFKLIVNPIFIDEKKFEHWLYHPDEFELFKVTQEIGHKGSDYTITLPGMVSVVDTHVAVTGTDAGETITMADKQPMVDALAGDDTVIGNADRNLIYGGEGNDTISGGAGDDEIHGGKGSDTIDGGAGNDLLYSEAALATKPEVITGGAGNDRIEAGGPGTYDGGADDDQVLLVVSVLGGQTVRGGTGNDELTADFLFHTKGVSVSLADSGTGTLLAATASRPAVTYEGIETFTLKGSVAKDVFTGSKGADTLDGRGGNDILSGAGGDDTILGRDGVDTIHGDGGNDVVSGGAGDDQLFGDAGDDGIDGGVGNDTIRAGSGSDVVSGDAGNDTIYVDDKDGVKDVATGDDGDDVLRGGTGKDELNGVAGNDRLYAGSDGGTLYGGDGDDQFWGAATAIMHGGSGSDTFNVTAKMTGMQIFGEGEKTSDPKQGQDLLVLGAGVAAINEAAPASYQFADFDRAQVMLYDSNVTLTNGTTAVGIENFDVRGTAGADAILFGKGDDTARGGKGNDYLDGGGGRDNLYGEEGDDALVGGLGAHYYGGSGNDTLYLRIPAGDELGANQAFYLDAGSGDTLFQATVGGVTTTTTLPGEGGGSFGTVLSSIEAIRMTGGGAGNDRISGGIGADLLKGGAGNDNLSGRSGDDTLIGGAGRDRVYGDAGNDFLDITDLATPGGSASLGGDQAFGGDGNDTIIATNSANRIEGGLGDDDISVGDGGNYGAFVTLINGDGGNDHIQGSNEAEIIFGGPDDETAPANLRSGIDLAQLDDDYIRGGGGDDTIRGGIGNDVIYGDAGADKLYGGRGDDTINADWLDRVFGGLGDDLVIIAPTLTPPASPLVVTGGAGTDTVRFAYTGRSGPLSFTLAGTGTTTVAPDLKLVTVEVLDIALSDGNDFVTAGAGNDTIRGGLGSDTILGGGGNDVLYGLGVALRPGTGASGAAAPLDSLVGNAGNDRLVFDNAGRADGGAGTDTLEIHGLNAAIGRGVFIAGGTGTLAGIDYTDLEALDYTADLAGGAVGLRAGTGADRLVGSDAGDTLDGGGGNDTISGMGGNDMLKVGAITGQAVLDGGLGFDTADIDLASSSAHLSVLLTALPLPGTGAARPVSPVRFTSVEALVITTGSGSDAVTGGARADRISTGSGDDRVNSGLGADTVSLGDGNDLLIDQGGNGDVIDAGRGDDRVTIGKQAALVDGGEGNDRITADLSSYTGLSVTLALGGTVALPARGSALKGFEEYVLTFGSGNDTVRADYGLHQLDGGAGTDTLVIVADDVVSYTTHTVGAVTTYTFANGMVATGFESVTFEYRPRTLIGTAADDVLVGGPGNDLLSGGKGTDRLTGGDGADSFRIDLLPTTGSGADTITDFHSGEDHIVLDSRVFTQFSAYAGSALPAAELADGTGHLVYDAASGRLSYVTVGASPDPIVIAALAGGGELLASDILII